MSKGRISPAPNAVAQPSRAPRPGWLRALLLGPMLALVLAGSGSTLRAQEIVPLLSFAHEWRYHDTGADLGAAWREDGYDDSNWPAGPGLLQAAEGTPYPVPFRTAFPSVSARITCYFRARFNVPSELAPRQGVVLYMTNFVDDGCVLYLNGVEAERIRMPSGTPVPLTYSTLASAGPATEGQPDVLTLDGDLLRPGDNLLCVEVHQVSSLSPDVVWGAALAAQVSHPLSITRQPVGSTNSVGDAVTLAVEVSGSPVTYRWVKDGQPLAAATNAHLTFPDGTTNDSGTYGVIVSNAFNRAASAAVQVLFLADRSGPIVESATVMTNPSVPGASNLVDLFFNETVQPPTVADFSVIRLRTGESIPLSNVVISSVAPAVRLRIGATPGWVFYDDYAVELSGLLDRHGNPIAPGTRVPVRWPRLAPNLIHSQSVWRIHNSAFFEPEIYDQDWTATNFVESSLWGSSTGPFHHFDRGFDSCFGWIGPAGTEDAQGIDVGYQPEPYLFRTTFAWPATNDLNATLRLSFLADDSAVFYLNGQEFHRHNAAGGSITAQTRALISVNQPPCQTNLEFAVTNLFAGTNWIAVALPQSTSFPEGDVGFAFHLDVRYTQVPRLPDESGTPPALIVESLSPGLHRLSWTAGGYALEGAPTLDNPLSYPSGPWTEVSAMANPFLLPVATNGPVQFYRLKRK